MKRALQLKQGNTVAITSRETPNFICILPFFHANVLSFDALIPKNIIYL